MTTKDALVAAQALLEALDATSWSSWQTKAMFSTEQEKLRKALAEYDATNDEEISSRNSEKQCAKAWRAVVGTLNEIGVDWFSSGMITGGRKSMRGNSRHACESYGRECGRQVGRGRILPE